MLDDDFRDRAHNDHMLWSITQQMVSMLANCYVTVPDLARCAVLATQLYAERYHSPYVLTLRDGESREQREARLRARGFTFERPDGGCADDLGLRRPEGEDGESIDA